MDKLVNIAAQFYPPTQGKLQGNLGKIVKIEPWGSGNVNDTFRVTVENGKTPYFILQRLNTHVFRQPDWVMGNIRVLSDHIQDHLQADSTLRWQVPQVLTTGEGKGCWYAEDGTVWRALGYIEGTCYDAIATPHHATEVGYGLGMFHRLLSDLPPHHLADTLEGFHITPRYLQEYDRTLEKGPHPTSAEVQYCCNFISDHRSQVNILETAKQEGKLPLRVIHGDPKVNNVILDETTGNAVSMIDLDTVKPGLIHYDIGDCLRSGCNPLGEETQDWEKVYFDPDLCQSILRGYLPLVEDILTDNEYHYIYDSIRLITFELGLRFFTDYLAGNLYFKAKYPEHNLNRALVQFKLTQSIEKQANVIGKIIGG
ncbi:aminoglycoside phosphotransferase family protein [Spirulina sp. CS-785/01]|uniref:phosphotransferase enzyme family protein n=1 Tax=Spirulina sp. CS-785/01 TaxID=3021716 RepID=UPI0023304355|nr:aminoglycoside phosphotransferase family protein [Spirulina sp. CS-785/01]MDB9312501.1 aminoglycoside phosphotransferase family protein [Spirulina sp. CS-785/01]